MTWTTPTDLRAQLQKIWDKGQLLQPSEAGGTAFPLRLRFAVPSSTEMSARFNDVRSWMAGLHQGSARLRFIQREFRHSVLGQNSVPVEAWVDSLADALALIGKQKEAQRFAALMQITQAQNPALLPWLQKRPLNALALEAVWLRLLAVVSWLQNNPRPGIYLRQVDSQGVDSKFIESNRSILAELLDLALPTEAIDALAAGYSGLSQFCSRYGFKDKPLRIRFRLLDPALALITLQSGPADQDIGVTQTLFEQLDLPVKRVFITENEVNFLAFPPVAGSLVIFGSGYGFDVLAGARWLQKAQIFYWGDIDTHGFAILDQLRATLPQAASFLMDSKTLLAHEKHWGEEPKTENRNLPRLSLDEQVVYDSLRDERIRPGLRLEQERIAFGWMQQALAALPDVDSPHD